MVWRASRLDQRVPSGAIVVLGAAQYNGRPSPVLRARLDHAYGLFRDGLAPLIVVTGGIGKGDRESEADVGRRYLEGRGVPPLAIVVRGEGRSTAESMESVAAWLHGRQGGSVLLVSDGFHMCRLRLEARRVGIPAATSPTTTSPIAGSRAWIYFLEESLKVPVAWVKSW